MNIGEKMKEIKAQLEVLKTGFQKFIVDQSVPLDERWQAWLDAPAECKNQKGWIEHFTTLPGDFIMYDGPYHAERYETVKMADFIERVEEGIACEEEEYVSIDLNALKEEILSKNLASFTYDW